jgi:hypothetical protein
MPVCCPEGILATRKAAADRLDEFVGPKSNAVPFKGVDYTA